MLVHAGSTWSEAAGGTSRALRGAALTAAGRAFDDQTGAESRDVREALVAAVGRLGGAQVGNKTMMDATLPFRACLTPEFDVSDDLAGALRQAATVAREAADRTADIEARLGGSPVLGHKSVGTPAPGALSFALIADALADHLAGAH